MIRLNNITVFNANNTLPSTGTVLTVSSGKAYMLSLTTALEAIGISSLSTQLSGGGGNVANWANYAATSTVNMATNGIQGLNFVSFNSCTANSGAFASGISTIASGLYSHAEGEDTTANATSSHAEGGGTTASGPLGHAEGGGTTASGYGSHAEGSGTVASGNSSHAEGGGTRASTDYSHAEGSSTTASGFSSHAEGSGTTASGNSSHAEGRFCIAQGAYAHAQGWNSQANNEIACFAAGVSSIASNFADTVIGYGGRSRLPTNFVFGGGPVLSNGFAVFGGLQHTTFNMTTSNTASLDNTYQSSPLVYYTNIFGSTDSNIPFVTLGGSHPVAFQYTVKLTGYQQLISGTTLTGTGIFYGEYTFLTYIDSLTRPTICLCNATATNGPTTNLDVLSDKQINRFSGGLNLLDSKPTQLLADIYTDVTNRLVLKVNTASMSKANWIAHVERSEIALPY